MVVGYLALIEIGKKVFYRTAGASLPPRPLHSPLRHQRRRAAYFHGGGQR